MFQTLTNIEWVINLSLSFISPYAYKSTGLSDAFLIGDSELHVYHTLNVKNPDVLSETVVVFKAKPTCIRQQVCASKCTVIVELKDYRE